MKADSVSAIPVRDGRLWPLSIEAYHALGELGLIPKQSELLYGLVYKKVSKSPYHTTLVLRLMQKIQAALPPSLLLRSEQPVTCGDSEPEPDVSVVCGSVEDYAKEHPNTAELAIEVCVTSHEYDWSKLRAYANAGIKECWYVLGPEKQVEVYRNPVNGVFTEKTVIGPGGEVASAAIPGVRVALDQLFRE